MTEGEVWDPDEDAFFTLEEWFGRLLRATARRAIRGGRPLASRRVDRYRKLL